MTPFTKTIKPGVHLFRENDRSRELYIIQSGSVRVYRTAGGKEIELAVLEKGAVLGEMALIDGKPRSASVKAIEESSVIIIDSDTFHSRVTGIPAWFISIIRSTCQKIRLANRRLQNISSHHQGARITITLCLYFHRLRTQNKRLSVATIQQHLIQLLGVTYLDITNTLDFLCNHSIIELNKQAITIKDFSRLDNYCEYLRFELRNLYDCMDPADTFLAQLSDIIVSTFGAITADDTGSTPLEGSQFYHILTSNNLDENYLDKMEQLQSSGYITTSRKVKTAGSKPLSDLTVKLIHFPWKRAYLFYKFPQASIEAV